MVKTMKVLIMTPGAADRYETYEVDILSNGHPDYRKSLRPILHEALGGEPEHVQVFWNNEYRDMFVDEIGALKGREVNGPATEVYWNNVKQHDPLAYDPPNMPKIHGPAVLFLADKVWY